MFLLQRFTAQWFRIIHFKVMQIFPPWQLFCLWLGMMDGDDENGYLLGDGDFDDSCEHL